MPCGSGSAAAAHGFTSSSRKWTLNGRSCVASGIQYSTCSSPGSLDVTAAEYSSAHSLCCVALRCFALLCIGTPEHAPCLATAVLPRHSRPTGTAQSCSATAVCRAPRAARTAAVNHSVLSVLYGTLRSSTVLYSPLQYSRPQCAVSTHGVPSSFEWLCSSASPQKWPWWNESGSGHAQHSAASHSSGR